MIRGSSAVSNRCGGAFPASGAPGVLRAAWRGRALWRTVAVRGRVGIVDLSSPGLGGWPAVGSSGSVGRPWARSDVADAGAGRARGVVGAAGSPCGAGSSCSRPASGCGAGRGCPRRRCRTCRRPRARATPRRSTGTWPTGRAGSSREMPSATTRSQSVVDAGSRGGRRPASPSPVSTPVRSARISKRRSIDVVEDRQHLRDVAGRDRGSPSRRRAGRRRRAGSRRGGPRVGP